MDLMEIELPAIQHVQLDLPAVLFKLAEQISPGNSETLAMSIQRPDGIVLSMSVEKIARSDGERLVLDVMATEGETLLAQEVDKLVMNFGNIQSPVYLQTAKNKSPVKKSKKTQPRAPVIVEQLPENTIASTSQDVEGMSSEEATANYEVQETIVETLQTVDMEHPENLPTQEVRNLSDIIASGGLVMKDDETQCILDAGTILEGQTIGILENSQLEGIDGPVQIQINGQQLVNAEPVVVEQPGIPENQGNSGNSGEAQPFEVIEAAQNVEGQSNDGEVETEWWAAEDSGTTYEVSTMENPQDGGENEVKAEVGRVQLSGRDSGEIATGDTSEINISSASEIPRIMADVTGLKCNVCNKVYNSPTLLQGHYTRTHPEFTYNEGEMENVIIKNAYLCFICRQPFRRFDTMRKHLDTIHKLGTTKRTITKKIACPICKSKHSSIHTLRCHLGYMHRDDEKYDEALQYLQNKIYASKKVSRRNETALLQCPWCVLQLTMKQFRHHVNISHKDEPHVHSVLDEALKAVTEQRMERYKSQHKECQICHKVFSYKSYYTHMRRVHRHKQNPLDNMCNICNKKLHTGWHLKQHMLTHEETKKFKCEACGNRYRTSYSLKSHVKTIHMNIYRFRCELCSRGFHIKKILDEHNCKPLRTRKARPSHWPVVEEAGRLEKTKDEGSSKDVQGAGPSSETDGPSSENEVSVNITAEQNEDDTDISLCVVTNAPTENANEGGSKLPETSEEPWTKDVEKLASGKYCCRKCGKFYKLLDSVHSHIARVHGIAKTNGPAGNWMEHTDYLSSGVYRCKICGTTLGKGDSMRRHMRRVHHVVSGDKPIENIPCEICGKSFMMQSQLKSHMRIHTGERNHHCLQCSKSFRDKYHLADHVRVIHEGRYSKTCSVCGKGYERLHTCGAEATSSAKARTRKRTTETSSDSPVKDEDKSNDEKETFKVRITRNRRPKKLAKEECIDLDNDDANIDEDGDDSEDEWQDDTSSDSEDEASEETKPRKRTPAKNVQVTNKSKGKKQSETEQDTPSSKSSANNANPQGKKRPADDKATPSKISTTKTPAKKSLEKPPPKKKAKVDDIDKCLPKVSLQSQEKPKATPTGNSPVSPARSSRTRVQPSWLKVFTQ